MRSKLGIIRAFNESMRLQKNIQVFVLGGYHKNDFYKDLTRFLNAVKGGRLMAIETVSRSGNTANIKFLSCSKINNSNQYSFNNFTCLMVALGLAQYKTPSGRYLDSIVATGYQYDKIDFSYDRILRLLQEELKIINENEYYSLRNLPIHVQTIQK